MGSEDKGHEIEVEVEVVVEVCAVVWGKSGRCSDCNTVLSQLSAPSDRRFGGGIVGVEVDVMLEVV